MKSRLKNLSALIEILFNVFLKKSIDKSKKLCYNKNTVKVNRQTVSLLELKNNRRDYQSRAVIFL